MRWVKKGCFIFVFIVLGVLIGSPQNKVQASEGKVCKKAENSTVYDIGDGRKRAEYYSRPVRYKDEKGKLLDYDTSLTEVDEKESEQGESLSGYTYQTRQSDRIVYLPEKISEDRPVLGEYEKYQVKIAPFSTDKRTAAGKGKTVRNKVEDLYQRKSKKITSIIYDGVQPNIGFEYEATEQGIKENIILRTKKTANNYKFEVVLKNCCIVSQQALMKENVKTASRIRTGAGESLYLYDKEKEALVGSIPAAFMVDSQGVYSEQCTYEVKCTATKKTHSETEYTYQLSLTVDSGYLQDSERVYPVKIDPTFVWSESDPSRMASAYVCSSVPNTRYTTSNSNIMCVGMREQSSSVCRSYINFKGVTESLLKGKYIQSVRLRLNTTNSNTGMKIYVRAVTSAWDAGTITYSSQPTRLNSALANFTTSSSSQQINVELSKDVLMGVSQGQLNFTGIELTDSVRDTNTTSSQSAWVFNSSTVNSSKMPKLEITYQESPTTASSVTLGNAYQKAGSNAVISWSGITSPGLSSVKYEIYSYNDSTSKDGSRVVAPVKIGTSSSGTGVISTSGLSEGCYKVYVWGIDGQGNAGGKKGVVLHIDSTAPVVAYLDTISNDRARYVAASSSDGVNLAFRWGKITDSHSARIYYKINNGTAVYLAGKGAVSGKIPCSALTSGSNQIQIYVQDYAGNTTIFYTGKYYYSDKMTDVTLPELHYNVYQNDSGWLNHAAEQSPSGSLTNTKGIRAFSMDLNPGEFQLSKVQYRGFYEGTGWTDWKSDNEVAGYPEKSKKMKSIQIRVLNAGGDVSSNYEIYYRVYVNGKGWLGWAKNGAEAGDYTSGSYIQSVSAVLVPGLTYNTFNEGLTNEIGNSRNVSTPVNDDNNLFKIGIRFSDISLNPKHRIQTTVYTVGGEHIPGLSQTCASAAISDYNLIGGSSSLQYIIGYSMQPANSELKAKFDLEHVACAKGEEEEIWKKNGEISGSTTGNDILGMISARLVPKEYKKGGKACIHNDFCVMEDGFSFGNSRYDFNYPDTYYVSLEKYVDWYGEEEGTRRFKSQKPWRGNCFGMVMACQMILHGKVDLDMFKSNVDAEAAEVFELSGQRSRRNKKLTDFIEYLQIGPQGAQSDRSVYELTQNNTSNLIKLLKQGQRYQYIMAIESEEGFHAVLPLSISEMGGGKYKIILYDPNCPGEKCIANVDTLNNTFSYNNFTSATLDDFLLMYNENETMYKAIIKTVKGF